MASASKSHGNGTKTVSRSTDKGAASSGNGKIMMAIAVRLADEDMRALAEYAAGLH